MDRKLFFTLLVYSFTIFILYQVYSVISPFLTPLVLAGVICLSTSHFYQRLLARLQGRRNVAAAVMTFSVIVTFVGPMIGLSFLLSHEVGRMYEQLEGLASGGSSDMFSEIRRHQLVVPWLERFSPLLDRLNLDLPGALLSAAKGGMSLVVNYSGEMAKNVFTFVLKIVIMVIALFFFYRDGDRFQREFWSVIPLDGQRREIMIETIKRVLAGIIYGIFLTCLVQGMLGGLGFWIAGLPAPLLFGAIMAICALIPVVGTALVWVPGTVHLFMQGKILMGVFLVIWGTVAVSSIDNIIRPFFISGKARLSVLIVALGMLGGLMSFGMGGLIMGPVLLALFIALFEVYRAEIYPGRE